MWSRFYCSLLLGLAATGLQACSDANRSEISAPKSEDVQQNIITDEDTIRLEYGRELVTENCATCHAISRSDDSPRADAPPLRTVLATYDPENLTIDFVEHNHIGAPDMPDFDFGAKGSDAVVAYLKSIQEAGESD